MYWLHLTHAGVKYIAGVMSNARITLQCLGDIVAKTTTRTGTLQDTYIPTTQWVTHLRQSLKPIQYTWNLKNGRCANAKLPYKIFDRLLLCYRRQYMLSLCVSVSVSQSICRLPGSLHMDWQTATGMLVTSYY